MSRCDRTDPTFGGGVDLDNISNEFEGQGHRSKVKVARLKNVIFGFSGGLTWLIGSLCHVIWHHLTSQPDVMTSRNVTK